MKISTDKLPSNKSFGFFFTFIFLSLGIYLITYNNYLISYLFFVIGIILLLLTLIKAELLLSINILWFRLGIFLGRFLSPVILALIFFGIFSPIAIFMRFFGRDELKLHIKNNSSKWVFRSNKIKPESFKNQF